MLESIMKRTNLSILIRGIGLEFGETIVGHPVPSALERELRRRYHVDFGDRLPRLESMLEPGMTMLQRDEC